MTIRKKICNFAPSPVAQLQHRGTRCPEGRRDMLHGMQPPAAGQFVEEQDKVFTKKQIVSL